jgi:hypothetical protein
MSALRNLNGSLLTISHSIRAIRADENFHNFLFAIANEFALDQLLESANHLRGVPA